VAGIDTDNDQLKAAAEAAAAETLMAMATTTTTTTTTTVTASMTTTPLTTTTTTTTVAATTPIAAAATATEGATDDNQLKEAAKETAAAEAMVATTAATTTRTAVATTAKATDSAPPKLTSAVMLWYDNTITFSGFGTEKTITFKRRVVADDPQHYTSRPHDDPGPLSVKTTSQVTPAVSIRRSARTHSSKLRSEAKLWYCNPFSAVVVVIIYSRMQKILPTHTIQLLQN